MMPTESFAIQTAQLRGVVAVPITVEVGITGGIPAITIVGCADSVVMESKMRVRNAFKECGFTFPRVHITINLAPAEMRKTGTAYDFPIALAILAATKQIQTAGLDSCMFVGELGLNGDISTTRGTVAYERLAHEMGLTLVLGCVEGSLPLEDCLVCTNLSLMRDGVDRCIPLTRLSELRKKDALESASEGLDFADVIDQDMAKRAFLIAAVGNHGLMMMGPPGAGKTMLARRMPTILPRMSDEELNEALLIHSVAGAEISSIAQGIRPFRAPHHSISQGGLIGGGRPVLPGEVSLAHQGVLFLDEMPEFAINVLQALRQPLEEHEVRLVRVDGVYTFPCRFQLIAAANPCPCGHLGDPGHVCTCSGPRIASYQSRIGGPLMDRIDVLVDVARPDSQKVIEGSSGLSSADMRSMLDAALEFRGVAREKQADGRQARHRGIRILRGRAGVVREDIRKARIGGQGHRARGTGCTLDSRSRTAGAGNRPKRSRGMRVQDALARIGVRAVDPLKHLVRPGDECYPEHMHDLEEPPDLYVLGNPEVLRTTTISIIGARLATPYGLAATEMAARISAECSLTVVSGGARGCDHAASRSALDAGGSIIIVAGTGADRIYPAESSDIFHEAAEGRGAVVSLLPWGTGIQKFQFPQRNRIIAALSRALFVAEAGLRSGTLSTAETAKDLGRSLYAVPGSIFSPTSSGANQLIADGATIICDEADLEQSIAREYGLIRGIIRHEGARRGEVLSALFASPSRPRELSERLNQDVLTVLKTISEYEVLGMVSKLPDGRYIASKEAFLSHNRG